MSLFRRLALRVGALRAVGIPAYLSTEDRSVLMSEDGWALQAE